MVGSSAEKNSRIFQQCYVKCCKLQNLTPLTSVIPSGNGKVVDFCVDRIKYVDWAPILNALSFDLSLHSVSIRCRQAVKNILEQVDCERLAKTVNKRPVILTNFILSNLMEALVQLLTNTTLLNTLLLEGLVLKPTYLNPVAEALTRNSSLQHLALPRCAIGDAGCLAICTSLRRLPNVQTLDLSCCEITSLGAEYLADLIKYQKIHRYSENWVHTLRYRLPELDTQAGLRRLTLCGNPLLDAGAATLIDVLSDDLWIKAVDLQNCGLSDVSAEVALNTLNSNNKLVILDMRYNSDITLESLSKIKSALRRNEDSNGAPKQYTWLSCTSRSSERIANKNSTMRDRKVNQRSGALMYAKATAAMKDKVPESARLCSERRRRRQLEELNAELVRQMQELRRAPPRAPRAPAWDPRPGSSGSELSVLTSGGSCEVSSSSGSARSVPVDQHTLAYIQHAFQDIYAFIQHNQCTSECHAEPQKREPSEQPAERPFQADDLDHHRDNYEPGELAHERANMVAKKAPSDHVHVVENLTMKKITKSAHLIGSPICKGRENNVKPEMFERQMGDTKTVFVEEPTLLEAKKRSASEFASVESSSTLVCTSRSHELPSPARVLFSSASSSSDLDSD